MFEKKYSMIWNSTCVSSTGLPFFVNERLRRFSTNAPERSSSEKFGSAAWENCATRR